MCFGGGDAGGGRVTGAEEVHNCFFYGRLSLIKPVGGKGASRRVMLGRDAWAEIGIMHAFGSLCLSFETTGK